MSWLIPTSAPAFTGEVRTIRKLTDEPDRERVRRDTPEQRRRQYLRYRDKNRAKGRERYRRRVGK